MARLPTHKQRRFAEEYLKGKTLSDSVKTAYPNASDQSAGPMGSELIRKPHIQKYMQQVLDKAGLNDSYLADRLHQIIEASTDTKSLNEVKPSDGLRGIKMAYELKDRFPAQKQEIQKKEISLQLKDRSFKELNKMLQQNIKDAKRFTKMLQEERGGT